MAQLNNKVDTDIEAIALDDIAITVGVCKTGKYIYILFIRYVQIYVFKC